MYICYSGTKNKENQCSMEICRAVTPLDAVFFLVGAHVLRVPENLKTFFSQLKTILKYKYE